MNNNTRNLSNLLNNTKDFIKAHKVISIIIFIPIWFIFVICLSRIASSNQPDKNLIVVTVTPTEKPTPIPTPTLSAQQIRNAQIDSQFSDWDGSHENLTRYIKKEMNDPKSFEHVSTKYIDDKEYVTVYETFRGKNAFGALIKNTVVAKVSAEDGKILEVLSWN